MFGNPYGSGLSFTKVLSGISKTLNVANQVIPIYREAKPMIHNAKTIFSALKEFGKSNPNTTSTNTNNETKEEIKKEVIALQDMGHKRLALETGEDPINNPIEYVLESIKTIYSIKHKNGAIRRVNVNIAATTVENYRKLKKVGRYTAYLKEE